MGNRAFQRMVRDTTPTKTEAPHTIDTAEVSQKVDQTSIQPTRTVLGRIGWGALSTLGWTVSGAVPLGAAGGHVGHKVGGKGKKGGVVGAGLGGTVGVLAGATGIGGFIGGAAAIKVASDSTFGTKSERKGLDKKGNDLSIPVTSLNRIQSQPCTISDVEIPSTWGYGTLRGRKYTPRQTRHTVSNVGQGKTVILFSGSGGTNEAQLGRGVALEYCKRGYTAYGIDYRGYGKSSQRVMLSEAGMYKDAMRIYKFVKTQEGIQDGSIIIHGFSLGGAVASHLVKTLAGKKKRVGGLVLHSSIDSAFKTAMHGGSEEFDPVVGAYAGMATKAGVGDFNTLGHLKSLSKTDNGSYQDLPIHFMGGTKGSGDHLGLDQTKIDQTAVNDYGFTDTTSKSSNQKHMSTKYHMQSQDESLYSLF